TVSLCTPRVRQSPLMDGAQGAGIRAGRQARGGPDTSLLAASGRGGRHLHRSGRLVHTEGESALTTSTNLVAVEIVTRGGPLDHDRLTALRRARGCGPGSHVSAWHAFPCGLRAIGVPEHAKDQVHGAETVPLTWP